MRWLSVIGFSLTLLAGTVNAQNRVIFEGRVENAQGQGLESEIYIVETDTAIQTSPAGTFRFSAATSDTFVSGIVVTSGYRAIQVMIQAGQPSVIRLSRLTYSAGTIEVNASGSSLTSRHLRQVEGTAVYAGRKSDVIQLDQVQGNLAANQAREVYKGVAGLTIWEQDGSGLQLSIGARGLDPNRTSTFNTRQNGYDISADALGYPESYYTPPAQALERIEVVRGAASLQYGTQFGGLLNFVLRRGPEDRPIAGSVESTGGSFGFFSQMVSIGGQAGQLNHYTFAQYRRSDGWRPNSSFDQKTVISRLHWQISPRVSISSDLTHMNYLAQQPGGLQDFEFAEDPRQSRRSRNWFDVNWTLAALQADIRLSDKSHLNTRTFALFARRRALGELGPINRPDPMRNRNLIDGQYRNIGHETRLIHRHGSDNLPQTLLVGMRLYRGYTHNRQGDASDGSDADFNLLNPDFPEQSDFTFPGRNASLFAEHIFRLSKSLSLTPGLRAEYIRTASDGYYRYRVLSGGEVIFDQAIEERRSNERSFVLAGLGLSWMLPSGQSEVYANASQNYRSINFSDLVAVNPNLIIDSTLRDERGWTIEAGVRGTIGKGAGRFDISAFYLRYNDRIGLAEILHGTPERLSTFRTQVGDAGIGGVEVYGECELLQASDTLRRWSFRPFLNLSIISGSYLSGGSSIRGNQLELVPPLTIRTGFDFGYQNLSLSLLYTHVRQHFSDATNAVFVSDATRGLIPSYEVVDLSVRIRLGRMTINSGINNVLDRAYFTRRATGYPGPGIIPANGRSVYAGLRCDF